MTRTRVVLAIAVCMLVVMPFALADSHTFWARFANFFTGDEGAVGQAGPNDGGTGETGGQDGTTPGKTGGEDEIPINERPGGEDGTPSGTVGGTEGAVGIVPVRACDPCNTVVCGSADKEFVCPGTLTNCRNVYDGCRVLECVKPVGCTARVHTCYDYSNAVPPDMGVLPDETNSGVAEDGTVELDSTDNSNRVICKGTYEECTEKYSVCHCGLVQDSLCGNGVCEEGENSWCPQYDCKEEPCPLQPCYQGTCPQDCQKDAFACPDDAKVCPDGSTVGRVGPNCEFADCGSITKACPAVYNPVCGQPPYKCPEGENCAQLMPAPRTYSNKCMLEAAGAEFLHEGECDTETAITIK